MTPKADVYLICCIVHFCFCLTRIHNKCLWGSQGTFEQVNFTYHKHINVLVNKIKIIILNCVFECKMQLVLTIETDFVYT